MKQALFDSGGKATRRLGGELPFSDLGQFLNSWKKFSTKRSEP